jgi:hypothetical protein
MCFVSNDGLLANKGGQFLVSLGGQFTVSPDTQASPPWVSVTDRSSSAVPRSEARFLYFRKLLRGLAA